MGTVCGIRNTHPAGEGQSQELVRAVNWPVDTPGGRYYAEFDFEIPVTREGQLIFFAQFLNTGGLWERLIKDCPLEYRSNRGSKVVDVIGTAVLSILCGHWRYAHINSVRGDTVNPPLLGMSKTVSEDVVRRAMGAMEVASGSRWLGSHIRGCVYPMLKHSWILDIDSTIKTMYGHQQGAEIGYNPHKPGRPSHVYHSYFMANTRICLGVEVCSGKNHSGQEGLTGMWSVLKELPRTHWPTLIRGDCGYGNQRVMEQAEAENLPYVFKLRHTRGVKTLIRNLHAQGKGWQGAGEGWEVMEGKLRLSGWTQQRRVVVVREKPAVAPMGHKARRRRDHLGLPGTNQWQSQAAPWAGKIAVLVSSLDETAWPGEVIARLYRERADAENVYDELKNQWGWNGYTTQSIGASALMANLVALVYNWWHLYGRLYDSTHHREAIRSRPALLSGVGRLVRHGGQSTIKVSMQHEKSELIARAITMVSNKLQNINAIAERWTDLERWTLLLTLICRHWLGGKWADEMPPEAAQLLSG